MVTAGMSESKVEHMEALEELLSQEGQVRVSVLWVCSVLQNPANILAILASVERVWSNCCFCAGLCLGERSLGWGCWASLQELAKVRLIAKADPDTYENRSTVQSDACPTACESQGEATGPSDLGMLLEKSVP